ncbi:MAG: hypothetical protein AB7S38_09210 [Vulcanimicrobiota bacterium]
MNIRGRTDHRLVPPHAKQQSNPQPADLPGPRESFEGSSAHGSRWAVVLALGAAAAGLAGCCASPPPQPSYAGLVVFDDFTNADSGTTHGELVEKELTGRGSVCEVVPTSARQQVSIGQSMQPLEQGLPGSLDGYVREHFAGRMDNTTRGLQEQTARGFRLVINQSQGASESRVVEALWGRTHEPAFRVRLSEQLGLDAGVSDHDLMAGLLERVATVHAHDPSVAAARQRLEAASARADELGIIRVMSAGNQGQLYRTVTGLGLEVAPEFFRNDLATETTVLVGAADDANGPAALASPMAGAVLAADAVDRPLCVDGHSGHHSGSSYAAPQGSRAFDKLLRRDPALTREEALARVLQQTIAQPGAESELGAGILPDQPLRG